MQIFENTCITYPKFKLIGVKYYKTLSDTKLESSIFFRLESTLKNPKILENDMIFLEMEKFLWTLSYQWVVSSRTCWMQTYHKVINKNRKNNDFISKRFKKVLHPSFYGCLLHYWMFGMDGG